MKYFFVWILDKKACAWLNWWTIVLIIKRSITKDHPSRMPLNSAIKFVIRLSRVFWESPSCPISMSQARKIQILKYQFTNTKTHKELHQIVSYILRISQPTFQYLCLKPDWQRLFKEKNQNSEIQNWNRPHIWNKALLVIIWS